MLLIDVRTLAVKAVNVDGALSADDPVWLDGDSTPAGGIAVTGRLSVAGSGRFYFSGEISGTASQQCSRCLTAVSIPVTADVAVIFSDASTDDGDDPDVYPLPADGKHVDLRSAVREQWLLNAPTYARCRDDCRGICATCGADLNAGACSCAPAPDGRWDALRTARSSSS